MPTSQRENWDKDGFARSKHSENVEMDCAAGQPAAPDEGTFVAEAQVHRFHYRILVVNDEPSIREVAKAILENQGYEGLMAADLLDGLNPFCRSPSRCDHYRSKIRPAGRI